MPRYKLITVVLAAALLGVCGLSFLVAYNVYRAFETSHVRFRFFENATESAVITETLRFDVQPPASLVIDTAAGDVTVRADASLDGGTVVVEQTITAWAGTAAAALAGAKAIAVRVEHTPKAVRITYERPDELDIGGRGGRRDTASFDVRVPTRTDVNLRTDGGAIDLGGIEGTAELATSFGDVSAIDVRGALSADSMNGRLTIERVQAGDGDVTLSSSFGAISAHDVAGRAVTLRSNNGTLTAAGITAWGEAHVESDFGDLEVRDVTAGRLTLGTQNGAVNAAHGRIEGAVSAESTFGDVTLTDVLGQAYTVASTNGGVTLAGGSGDLDLSSNFGDVTVTGAADARLHLSSNNGDIDFSGSLDPASDHRVDTDFGGIRLALPADSRFDVRLETSFGKIRSDLPVLVSGEVADNGWSGALNGGGRRLDASTKNGDIDLVALTATVTITSTPTPRPRGARR